MHYLFCLQYTISLAYYIDNKVDKMSKNRLSVKKIISARPVSFFKPNAETDIFYTTVHTICQCCRLPSTANYTIVFGSDGNNF